MSGLERIRCVRCGANCFVGSQTCWNCGASLPPPEEAGAEAHVGASRPAMPAKASKLGMSRSAVIAIAVTVVFLWVAVTLARRAREAGVEARKAQLKALQERLERERLGEPGRFSGPITTDPTEAQARRELERLQRRLDSMSLPGASDDMRTRMGGQPR